MMIFRLRVVLLVVVLNVFLVSQYFLFESKQDSKNSFRDFSGYHQVLKNYRELVETKKDELANRPLEYQEKYQYIDSLERKFVHYKVAFLKLHVKSPKALSLLIDDCFSSSGILNKKQVNEIYQLLPDNLKNTDEGEAVQFYLSNPQPPRIGDIVLDFKQETPSGKKVCLSDLRGNYVLLKFWSSYCKPCRVENSWLSDIYRKYHMAGFEILAVSSDFDRKSWEDAIVRDSLQWINISQLNGERNQAHILYNITTIPYNILINPEGMVVYKNIHNYQQAEYVLNKYLLFD